MIVRLLLNLIMVVQLQKYANLTVLEPKNFLGDYNEKTIICSKAEASSSTSNISSSSSSSSSSFIEFEDVENNLSFFISSLILIGEGGGAFNFIIFSICSSTSFDNFASLKFKYLIILRTLM
uniref:Uncharacterized protein n=1 Tax=Meloidogyne enterolobii TaxID=390850 RepID=A0A6V7XSY5_MELEN|nr:unnamed protein product [Meloidogyne enterolobii]